MTEFALAWLGSIWVILVESGPYLLAGFLIAGMLKVAMALRDKQIPPSIGYEAPNPGIDFSKLPFFVNTELDPGKSPDVCTRSDGGDTLAAMDPKSWLVPFSV